jgi:hypothetical protein
MRDAARVTDLHILAGVTAAGALLLWAPIVGRAWSRATAFGPICSASGNALGHCAACVPALLLTLAAIGCFVAARDRALPWPRN